MVRGVVGFGEGEVGFGEGSGWVWRGEWSDMMRNVGRYDEGSGGTAPPVGRQGASGLDL